MEPHWPPFHGPTARKVWQEVLRPVAAEMQACAPQLAAQIVDLYRSDLPTVIPDAAAVAEQLASIEASVRLIAQCIETGEDPHRIDLAPATAAIPRSGAQRDIPLKDLIRSVRLGQKLIWQCLFDRISVTQATGDRDTALELVTNWLYTFVDVFLVQAENLYEIEREGWLGGASAARAAAVEEILAERETDPQRASKRLRYDINRHHVGVSIWLDAESEDHEVPTTFIDALARFSRAVSAQNTLALPAGSMAIVGWLSRPGQFTAADLDAANICSTAQLPDGVRVAIGEPGWGIGGFRRTRVEASHAHRFASLLGDNAPVVTFYRRVAVAALASADGEHAVAFVKRILGPLAANDEATFRVATTLAIYLEENRSPAKAAQRLTVHPNTVSYRVHQAEEILGRPIDINTLDLSVALALLPAIRGLMHPKHSEL